MLPPIMWPISSFKASGNPDADPKCGFCAGQDLVHRADQLRPGPHRPFRVVLMRVRVTEIPEHAITHVFGDEPILSIDRFSDPAMISADNFAQVFRIELRREGG
jgi:hypothetical protein